MSTPNDGSGWHRIVVLPATNYGDVTIGKLIRLASALGYGPDEVDVDCALVDDTELVISLLVPDELEPTLDRLQVVLEGWDPVVWKRDPEPTKAPSVEPSALPAAPEPEPYVPPVRSSETRIPCPQCDQTFRGPSGLASHARQVHDRPTPEPAALVTVPDPLADLPRPYWNRGEPMLGCADCDWYTNTAVTLAVHAAKVHNRHATDAERTPLGPDERAARLKPAAEEA